MFDLAGAGGAAAGSPRSRVRGGVFFAGAWWDNGFHEDGVAQRPRRVRAPARREPRAGRRVTGRPSPPSTPGRSITSAQGRSSTPSRCPCRWPGWTSQHCRAPSTGCRCGRRGVPPPSGCVAPTTATAGRGPLGHFVSDLVAARLGRRPPGPIAMLTHPRTLGYVFNPITVYFCGEPGSRGRGARAGGDQHPVARAPLVRAGRRTRARGRSLRQGSCTSRRSWRWTASTGSALDGPGTDLRIDLDLRARRRAGLRRAPRRCGAAHSRARDRGRRSARPPAHDVRGLGRHPSPRVRAVAQAGSRSSPTRTARAGAVR